MSSLEINWSVNSSQTQLLMFGVEIAISNWVIQE